MTTLFVTSLGLMGGSLAAAATAAGWTVLIHHRRPEVAAEAARRGWGRAVSPAEGMAASHVAVVCTPVEVVVEQVHNLAALPGSAVITDVGSIKGALVTPLSDLARAGRYVGSHPMCGSHRSGLDAARADLYRRALTILTPTADTPAAAIDVVSQLWSAVGCVLHRMDAAAHDRAMVAASHLPHVAASAVAAGLDAEAAPLTAGGFRDTTRVAAACPELWAGILRGNRRELQRGIAALQERLQILHAALGADDLEAIRAWLQAGHDGRARFDAGSPCAKP